LTANPISEATLVVGHSTVPEARAPHRWIVGETFDFFLVCGGAVWVLLALNYVFLGWVVPSSATQGPIVGQWLMILILIGQHVSADAHNAATYMRIYGSDEDQKRFRFYGKWLALACIPIFFIGISTPVLGSAMLYCYLITVFWHYAAQAFGIALIYCYKQDYKMTHLERETFRWFILSMSAFIAVRMLTYKEYAPGYFFGVTLPFWGPLPEWLFKSVAVVFIGSSIAFGITLLKKLVLERKIMPWPALLCISTLMLLGFAKGIYSLLAWFYVPVFFHGSQYLAVCLSYYLKERGIPQGMIASQIGRMLLQPSALKYMVTVIFVGAFFYIAIPHFFQSIGFDYSLVAAVVLATVNFHHFNTDAAIWRLRDPRCREFLLA
jgi:hypothetical protein